MTRTSDSRIPASGLRNEVENLELLARRLRALEASAARLQEESSRMKEAASSDDNESARLAQIKSVMVKIEELRTRTMRLEVALDALESTVASIESMVYGH